MNDNPRSFPKTLILRNPNKKHIKNVFEKVKKKNNLTKELTIGIYLDGIY